MGSTAHLSIIVKRDAKANPIVLTRPGINVFRHHCKGEEFFPCSLCQRRIQRGIGKDSRRILIKVIDILKGCLEHQLAVYHRRSYSIPLLAGLQLCPGVKHAVAGNLYGLGGI